MLSDRQVCADNTGIKWATNTAVMRFWLPMTDGIVDLLKAGSSVYSGCGGFSYDTYGCQASNVAARRLGNAGIIPDKVRACLQLGHGTEE